MTREYIEREPDWVARFRCLRNGNFGSLMKSPTGHWYWSYPDYQVLFPTARLDLSTRRFSRTRSADACRWRGLRPSLRSGREDLSAVPTPMLVWKGVSHHAVPQLRFDN